MFACRLSFELFDDEGKVALCVNWKAYGGEEVILQPLTLGVDRIYRPAVLPGWFTQGEVPCTYLVGGWLGHTANVGTWNTSLALSGNTSFLQPMNSRTLWNLQELYAAETSARNLLYNTTPLGKPLLSSYLYLIFTRLKFMFQITCAFNILFELNAWMMQNARE